MDSSTFCLSEQKLSLSGSTLEAFLYTLLFPPLCAFGLVGNALTISVLISRDFLSRANIFLTCLALCDICFLSLVIPHSLANFDAVGLNLAFRQFYLPSKLHLIAFANWCSAVAIWLVVGVSFERVIGVRWPLHQLSKPSSRKLITGLVILVAACAMLTFYNHVSHHCVIKSFCNHTQLISTCMDVDMQVWYGNRTNFTPTLLRRYVRWTRAAHAIFILIIPLILLIILNALLFYYVKNRSYFMYASLGKVTERLRKPGNPKLPCMGTLFRRHSDQILQQKTEHRVAVTVCAVVTSFTITQAPSAVVLCINTLWPDITRSRWKTEWYAVTVVTSFLVVIGKSINFVVFCLSSSTFRQRLLASLRSKCRFKEEKYVAVRQLASEQRRQPIGDSGRCQSVNTQYTRCDSRDSRVLSAKKSFQSI